MLIAVLENPNYIINIGHVIRNVCAFGIDKLYVVDGKKRLDNNADLIRQRKSLLKHSSGSVQFIEIERFDSSRECFDRLISDGFTSVGTTPDRNRKNGKFLHEADLTQPKLALWFGEEANGLSEEILEKCDFCATIEMNGNVESFNLGTTTGIVFYEAVKQRKKR